MLRLSTGPGGEGTGEAPVEPLCSWSNPASEGDSGLTNSPAGTMSKRSVLKRFTKSGRSKNDSQSPVAAGLSKRFHRTQPADPHSQTSQWGTTTWWSSLYTNMNYSSSVLVHAGLYRQPSVTHMLWFTRIAKSILMCILRHGCWFNKIGYEILLTVDSRSRSSSMFQSNETNSEGEGENLSKSSNVLFSFVI